MTNYPSNDYHIWFIRLLADGDIFALDKVYFPINQVNQHWACVVVHMQERRIQYLDSLGGKGMAPHYVEAIFRYLEDEHQDKKNSPLPNKEEWTRETCTATIPKQLNGCDCGAFVCMFIDRLARGLPMDFGQQDIYYFRRKIALSILNNELWE